ncbi:site-specific DNA-methyltransferase [Acinetobacter indicus]|uniref:site-specific DNA-methyltransferase n=1 Tax=Acinetobacter indicus TaxID=756892 RepID=UPI000B3E9445|nr:site-specific DNA-methyltransferase [Acinetobacter indicus]OUY10142.1 site-specific DNA-methyltransferase [Acinetobacter indicus]
MKVTLQDGQSLNIQQENIEALQQLFPELVRDGKVNFDVFRQIFGDLDVLEEGEEKFGLNWHGKKKARQNAFTPSLGTLLPCPEESLDWDTTQNLFIEGDNLEVLKLLQKSYANKVKMIYIDPPYNKEKDFIYPDRFQDNLDTYLKYTGQLDEDGSANSSEKETLGRKHTAWLNMMYPRIQLAKQLLTQDGAIFISIDDSEVVNLREICNEIFGEENFVAQIVWQKSKKGDSKLVAIVHEYILCYTKNKNAAIESGIWRTKKEGVDEVLDFYQDLRKKYESDHDQIREEMMKWYKGLKDSDSRKAHKHYNWSDDRGLYFPDNFAGPDDGRESRPRHEIYHPISGLPCKKPSTGWRWDEEKTEWALKQNPPRIHFGVDETTIPNRKSYLHETAYEPFASNFYQDGRTATLQVEKLLDKGVFQFPKNTDVLAKLMDLVTKEKDLILDFFAGSGSTAHACFNLNIQDGKARRFIMVQLPEILSEDVKEQKSAYKYCINNGLAPNIAEVSKARIKQVIASIDAEISLDKGLKIFKLASSNLKAWNPNAQDLEDSLDLNQNHILDGRTEIDVLYELLLKRGIDLATPIENREINSKTLYSIGYGAVFACLDDSILASDLNVISSAIIEWHKELAPSNETHIFFKDSAFQDDVVKTNLAAILEQNGLKHVRSL